MQSSQRRVCWKISPRRHLLLDLHFPSYDLIRHIHYCFAIKVKKIELPHKNKFYCLATSVDFIQLSQRYNIYVRPSVMGIFSNQLHFV